MIFRLAVGTFIASCIALAFANWRSTKIQPVQISEELKHEPVQTPTVAKPFGLFRGGIKYHVEPVAEYEIHGLVVSSHDSNSMFDISHKLWGDRFNTRDICLLWGQNAESRDLGSLDFSSGEFTCWVHANSGEVWSRFRMNQISNNHLLPASDEIERSLAAVRIGDEVTLRGQLVNYKRPSDPQFRVSSTTRDDTGNGACEIIYVTEVIKGARHLSKWRHLATAAFIMLAASIALAIFGVAQPFFFEEAR